MSKTEKHLISLLVAGAVVIGFLFAQALFQRPQTALGNGNITEGNFATSTRNSTGNAMASSTQLATASGHISGVLTSFCVFGTGAAAVTFYDATTSNANLRTITATSSLKVIAAFPASVAVGCYSIDGNFNNGLLYDVSGNSSQVPTSTVAWKI